MLFNSWSMRQYKVLTERVDKSTELTFRVDKVVWLIVIVPHWKGLIRAKRTRVWQHFCLVVDRNNFGIFSLIIRFWLINRLFWYCYSY